MKITFSKVGCPLGQSQGNYWLSATNFGCLRQPERPYFKRWLCTVTSFSETITIWASSLVPCGTEEPVGLVPAHSACAQIHVKYTEDSPNHGIITESCIVYCMMSRLRWLRTDTTQLTTNTALDERLDGSALFHSTGFNISNLIFLVAG